MKLRSYVWNELRSPEITIARNAGAVVFVPIGATEQHGAHLPLNTDILSVTSIALAAAKRSKEPPILVAQVANIGFSPHHMMHPGTISLRLETFTALIRDVVTSLHRHGFHKIILVNGHGGNIAPSSAIAHQLTADGMPVVFCSYWDLILSDIAEALEGSRKTVGHAGEFETSLLLHLKPQGVNLEEAVDESRPPWNPKLLHDKIMEIGAMFPPVFVEDSTGVLGDASRGSADKGRMLFEASVRRLVDLARLVAETDFPNSSV